MEQRVQSNCPVINRRCWIPLQYAIWILLSRRPSSCGPHDQESSTQSCEVIVGLPAASMQTLLSSHTYPAIALAIGIAICYLPKLGQAVLAFLRDLDDYRVNRRDLADFWRSSSQAGSVLQIVEDEADPLIGRM